MVSRLLLVLTLLLVPAIARSAEPPVSPEAKRHVDLGVDHYNAGRFAEAAQEFELAYRISARPALLFNIARAEAKLGHDEAAIAFLRRYLEERPNAPDAQAVMAEIEALERSMAENQAKAKAEHEAKDAQVEAARAQKAAAEAQVKVAEARREAERLETQRHAERIERERAEHLSTLRKSGIALTVVGAVFVVVGISVGATAAQAGDQVEKKSGEFADCCVDLQRRGQTMTSTGIVFDVIGGAAAVAGVGLLVAGRNPTASQHVWLSPRPAGISVGGSW